MTLEQLKRVLLALGVQHPNVKIPLRAVMDTLTREDFDPSRIVAARRSRVAAYEALDFTPPKAAQNAASRGLELRKKQEGDKAGLTTQEAGEQGIGSGVQRAADLKAGKALSPDTIRQMHGFFSRFQALIKKARKLTKEDDILESNMYVSDLLWGGAPAQKWAEKLVSQMDAEDKKKEAALARRVATIYLNSH
jgi:hypothetical protein